MGYAWSTSIFGLCLTLSVAAPCMLYVAFVFFLIKYFVDTTNLHNQQFKVGFEFSRLLEAHLLGNLVRMVSLFWMSMGAYFISQTQHGVGNVYDFPVPWFGGRQITIIPSGTLFGTDICWSGVMGPDNLPKFAMWASLCVTSIGLTAFTYRSCVHGPEGILGRCWRWMWTWNCPCLLLNRIAVDVCRRFIPASSFAAAACYCLYRCWPYHPKVNWLHLQQQWYFGAVLLSLSILALVLAFLIGRVARQYVATGRPLTKDDFDAMTMASPGNLLEAEIEEWREACAAEWARKTRICLDTPPTLHDASVQRSAEEEEERYRERGAYQFWFLADDRPSLVKQTSSKLTPEPRTWHIGAFGW